MIRRKEELRQEPKERIRGGVGRAIQRSYLTPGDMLGVEFASAITLEADASVEKHRQPGKRGALPDP